MNARKGILAASLGLAGVVLPLVAAGSAQADESDPTAGYPSTQNPLQVLPSGVATLGNTNTSFVDALDTFSPNNRPDGANGTDTEFPQADYRFLEGPGVGLIKNGPFQ